MPLRERPGEMQGNWFPPSRSRYTLDLDDIMNFPDIENLPVGPPQPGETWYILTEIKRDQSILRPAYLVEDKLPGHYYTIAFYTPNPQVDARDCRVGGMICVKDGNISTQHHFMDGQVGYRIEDPQDVIVLPCSMSRLRRLNESLRQRYLDGLYTNCVMCDRRADEACSHCQTRYCSTECQRNDWPQHKRLCKALGTLHMWNRMEFG